MPELPDLTVYLESLGARIVNRRLLRVRLLNPFLLRTAVPPLQAVEGRIVGTVTRLGKRIVIGLEDELYLVLHLMIAGILADRALSRLLKKSWPRSIDELG